MAPDGNFARFENTRDEELDFMLIEAEPTGEQVSARVRRDTVQNVYVRQKIDILVYGTPECVTLYAQRLSTRLKFDIYYI